LYHWLALSSADGTISGPAIRGARTHARRDAPAEPGRVLAVANSGFGAVRLAPYGREAMDALPEAGLRAEQLSVERLAELYGKLSADCPRAAFDLPPAGIRRNRCLPPGNHSGIDRE
jgi:hypothetical protein